MWIKEQQKLEFCFIEFLPKYIYIYIRIIVDALVLQWGRIKTHKLSLNSPQFSLNNTNPTIVFRGLQQSSKVWITLCYCRRTELLLDALFKPRAKLCLTTDVYLRPHDSIKYASTLIASTPPVPGSVGVEGRDGCPPVLLHPVLPGAGVGPGVRPGPGQYLLAQAQSLPLLGRKDDICFADSKSGYLFCKKKEMRRIGLLYEIYKTLYGGGGLPPLPPSVFTICGKNDANCIRATLGQRG